MVGCSRGISSIRFYPMETSVEEKETETETQGKELYFELSYDNEIYHDQNIVGALAEDNLTAENVTEFNIKIPENARFDDFCMYKDELYYTYNYVSYEIEEYYNKNNLVEHTEELYTRVMCYNYNTGLTRCVYEIETPGVYISELRIEGNIAVWNKYYSIDFNPIYGYSGVDDVLINRGVVTEIVNLETGTIMEVVEGEENGYLVDLTHHPYLIYTDYETKFYKYDFTTEKTTTLIENVEDFRVFCSDDVIAYLVEKDEYKEIVLYDYDGEYLCSFRTNAPWVYYVIVNNNNVVIVTEDFDGRSVFIVYDGNNGGMYMVNYNAEISNVVCSGSKIYTGDFGNSGIRVFDITSGKASSDYYGNGAMQLYYSSTGGVYAQKNPYGSVNIEDSNQIIEFVVFNE